MATESSSYIVSYHFHKNFGVTDSKNFPYEKFSILLLSLQIVQLANAILAISQARNSNGRNCSDLIQIFLEGGEDNDEVSSYILHVLTAIRCFDLAIV